MKVLKARVLKLLYYYRFRYGRSYWNIPYVIRIRMKFSNKFGHRTLSSSIRTTNNSLVLGKYGIPFDLHSTWCLGPFRDQPGYLSLENYGYLADRYSDLSGSCSSIEGVVYSTLSRVDVNYFHWLVESCSQLLAIRDYMHENSEVLSVIYRVDGPTFIVHSLQLLLDGLNYKLIPSKSENYSCDLLLTTVFPDYITTIDQRNLIRIRELLSARIQDSQPTHERIYVQRKSGGWRYVLNDDTLETALIMLGFCVIQCENLTLDEQIQTFRSAKIIVGMHGAGLTNLMFASNPVLVELRGDYGGNDYERLCAAMNSRHVLFSCADVDHNVIVEISRLVTLIRSFIDSPSA